MLCGIVIDIALFQFLVASITMSFMLESNYLGNKSDERVSIDLRGSLGFANEFEKPSRNDSKLTVTIGLKNALTHKKRLLYGGIQAVTTFICQLMEA